MPFKSETTSFLYFLGSGGKKTFKQYLKSEHTDGQTHRQTDTQTDRRTNPLIESIGPEGGYFEN